MTERDAAPEGEVLVPRPAANRAGLLLCDGDAVTTRNAVICRFDASGDVKRVRRIVAGALFRRLMCRDPIYLRR